MNMTKADVPAHEPGTNLYEGYEGLLPLPSHCDIVCHH